MTFFKNLFPLILLIIFTSCQEKTVSTYEYEKDNNSIHNIEEIEIAFPEINGELLKAGVDEKITLEKKGEHIIFQGDIILSEKQIEFLYSQSDSLIKGRTFLNTFSTLWPNNTVYYKINSSVDHPNRVNSAISHWESNTNLNFVARTSQSNYVEFTTGSGCSSNLGMIGGKQQIKLSSDCTRGNTIHEIGHAIGFLHEHTRSDRDNYVTVNYDNISSSDKVHNFEIYGDRGIDGHEINSLDFNSIMIYGSNAFSNGGPTIVKNDGSTFTAQRNGLSSGDIESYNFMYNPNVYAKIETVYVGDRGSGWDYHRIYDNEVKFYSDLNFSTPKTLNNSVKFKYKEYVQNDPYGNPYVSKHHVVKVPAGTSSFSLGQTAEIARFGANGDYEAYYHNWHETKDGVGYK